MKYEVKIKSKECQYKTRNNYIKRRVYNHENWDKFSYAVANRWYTICKDDKSRTNVWLYYGSLLIYLSMLSIRMKSLKVAWEMCLDRQNDRIKMFHIMILPFKTVFTVPHGSDMSWWHYHLILVTVLFLLKFHQWPIDYLK